MITSIRGTIRAFVAPHHKLACSPSLWERMREDLARRGGGRRESGAFLLGTADKERRSVVEYVLYDDLEPACLDSGIVVFQGAGYGPLWAACRERKLTVVADIHTHFGVPRQSEADRTHPMIATPGHIAIIMPHFAERRVPMRELGLYHYLGDHQWDDWTKDASRRLYVGRWA